MADKSSEDIDNVPSFLTGDYPYKERNLSSFPEWWQENIVKFREYGMPVYKPPVFQDGVIAPEQIAALEERFGIKIRMRNFDPQRVDEWEITIDDETVTTIERHRHPEGFPMLAMTADEFVKTIEQARSSPD